MSEWVGLAVGFGVGFLVGMWFGAIWVWHWSRGESASKKEDAP